MAIGGFGGFLGNVGAIAGGAQQYQLRDAAYRQALAQLAAEQRRQQLFDLQMKEAQQEQQSLTAQSQALSNLFGQPQSGAGGGPDTVQAQPLPPIGGGGGQPMGLPQAPSYGATPMGNAGLNQTLNLIARDESGGRNIPNYKFDAGHTASGPLQITDSTWNRYAPSAGAPKLSYPASPMDRPIAEQYKVGGAILKNEGTAPWANFNPRLAADLRQGIQVNLANQVRSGVPQPSARDSAQTALDAASNIDPTQWGRSTLRDVVAAVDKSNPGLDPAVKMLAVGNLMKLMAPEDKMAFQMFMQQNRQTMQLAIKEMQMEQQRTIAEERLTQQGALANQRIADADARAQLAQGSIAGTFQQGGQTYGLTRGGQTKLLDLPAGATKAGSQPRSAGAMSLRTFMDEYAAEHDGKMPSATELRNFQAGMAEATAEGRTTGTRAAGMEMGANVAEALIPLLREKSEAIDRTRFPDVNSLILASETKTGGTDVVQYGEMVNSLRYAFARVMAPSGAGPRVADLNHFDEIFNKNWSKGQVNAALDQIQTTINRERAAIGKSKEAVRTGGAAVTPSGQHKYQVGQIVDTPKGKARVVGGDLDSDPDVEPVQ